jgi:hypothetical protein
MAMLTEEALVKENVESVKENVKESRLLYRLILTTSLIVLAFTTGREDTRVLRRAYNELRILHGLSSTEYLDFAKSKIPSQSVSLIDDVTIPVMQSEWQKVSDKGDTKEASTIDRSIRLARELSFHPLATSPSSPLSGSLQDIRTAMSSIVGPYIFAPDYVNVLQTTEKALKREFDASYRVNAATWGTLECDGTPQRLAKCHAPLTLDLDSYQFGKTQLALGSVPGELSEAYRAAFSTWIVSLHPELMPLHETESERQKIGMGGYRVALAGLSRIWDEVESSTVSQALAFLRTQLREKEARITIFEVSFGGSGRTSQAYSR